MRPVSQARAALLTIAMNIVPAAPVDIFRFLRVPAVVLTLRRVRARVCTDAAHGARRRRNR